MPRRYDNLFVYSARRASRLGENEASSVCSHPKAGLFSAEMYITDLMMRYTDGDDSYLVAENLDLFISCHHNGADS